MEQNTTGSQRSPFIYTAAQVGISDIGGARSKYKDDETDKIVEDYINECRLKRLVPYREEMCDRLDITKETMNQWTKEGGRYYKYTFSDLIKKLDNLQEKALLHGGLTNQFNVTMSIFLLKTKHKYIETDRLQHVGQDGQPIKLNIIGGGYTGYKLPESGPAITPSTGSDMGSAPVQGVSVAPEGQKDVHVDNRVDTPSNT